MTVFAPVRKGREFRFEKLKKKQKLDLNGYINTEFPPKSILMPEGEALVKYRKNTICEVFGDDKKAIFAIRPCDVHAMLLLDKVMMGHGDIEEHYEARRKNLIVIAMNCTEAGENCFCESMETDRLYGGFDLLFTENGNSYHVEAGSEEGRKIIDGSANLFRKSSGMSAKTKPGCTKKIDTAGLPELMKKAAKSSIWEDTAKRCLSCASCTFVCPTCYCFSLKHEPDVTDLKNGEVKREMDYCMLLRFSKVAGDYVFRQHRAERVKQFFYHKLVYGLENEGKSHCVGCGRCITECMAGIDITEEAAKVRKKYAKV